MYIYTYTAPATNNSSISMDSSLHMLISILVFVLVSRGLGSSLTDQGTFDQYYNITWGNDHVLSLDQGAKIQLSLDNSSGSGFGSKLSYGSGFFQLGIKLPGNNSAGVVTAFYLTSHTDNHDELDFEFLGNQEGKPITVQTNVFVSGQGGREERIFLWFDPTANFHTYKVLWNPYQVVFYVDEIPIRVFKNNRKIGVSYPSQPMQVVVSLWNGDSWATDGGKTKINWIQAPFKAYFQGFKIDGCPHTEPCDSSTLWWNGEEYWTLSSNEQRVYKDVISKYITYDYCADRNKYPIPPPECPK
ncbi:hypothetical protein HHK36_027108 [Tetracentron sinense]|uniref:Xyloglucan endotransglucosylase/hydrolase n=1 Tax=Tetracentron sinense TaxID=13715 RepID=A0A835D2U7_TETSI|nr:hypothetical protein HHK36_027108 [Tetracentron sinense]